MERKQILDKINEIRDEQDKNWPRDARRIAMYSFHAPHILILEEQIKKLHTDWYNAKKEDCTYRFFHIAAIAIRALEEIKPFD